LRLLISTLALVASLGLAGESLAQPSGGPDAKGNAPLKAAHTINDGAAKPGASSFTEGQARQHILHSGYSSVSGLAKGADGVWRGAAMKGGATVNVALDFKGNVSEAAAAPVMPHPAAQAQTVTSSTDTRRSAGTHAGAMETGRAPAAATVAHRHHHMRHHHHWRRHHRCENPGPNGVACSGIDRNKNGISDKEDHALGR
jgi:putative membrane protein